jgi:hypothetical protein
MIGNNSCGPHSVMAGKTVENIERLEVLTYDGARFWCGPTSADELKKVLGKNDRQAQIYRGLKRIADRYGELIPPALSEDAAPGFRLQPRPAPARERLQRGARAGRLGRSDFAGGGAPRDEPRERVLVIMGFEDICAAGDAIGMATERTPPKLAPRTFRSPFSAREGVDASGERVVLFEDTFNNHFRPATALAARARGGRLRRPSTRSRHELAQLFPNDPRAARLRSSAVSLSEFLAVRGALVKVAAGTRIVMHAHCHQKALWGTQSDVAVLRPSLAPWPDAELLLAPES